MALAAATTLSSRSRCRQSRPPTRPRRGWPPAMLSMFSTLYSQCECGMCINRRGWSVDRSTARCAAVHGASHPSTASRANVGRERSSPRSAARPQPRQRTATVFRFSVGLRLIPVDEAADTRIDESARTVNPRQVTHISRGLTAAIDGADKSPRGRPVPGYRVGQWRSRTGNGCQVTRFGVRLCIREGLGFAMARRPGRAMATWSSCRCPIVR